MSPRRVAPDEAVAAAAALAGLGRTAWVGVDGLGAAGKSTLAARIAAAAPSAIVLHTDHFAGPGISEWDWDRCRTQVLVPLLDGRPGRYQRREWGSDTGGGWHDVPVGRLVVVEGVSATRAAFGAPWDLTIWVDAPREVRLARARERDGPALLATWLDDWLPSEERYMAAERPAERVDLIVG